jgi:glycosyltransferase involved in cell wall biosynthesis
MPSFVIITPTRDEDRTVERTLRSMTAQTIRPLRWVIVNDGSTDRTRAIVAPFVAQHDWIELVDRDDRGRRELGRGVIQAFYAGFERVRALPWDYVVKLDADLELPPDYFENMLREFERDPRLGMASGKTFLLAGNRRRLEYCHDEHVRGPAKMYRRRCFEEIGGIEPMRGWDMIDETRAQMRGWRTRSFLEYPLLHLRPIDARQSNVLRSRFDMGRLHWFLGYHWLYHYIRCARCVVQEPPRILGGLMLATGYLLDSLRRRPQFDPEFTRFVRARQKTRLRWAHFTGFIDACRGHRPRNSP